MHRSKSKFFIILGFLFLVSCSQEQAPKETSPTDLKEYFKHHKIGSSSDYAVIKNGDDYLLTIHGYMDDKQTCEDIIKPLNADPKLSTLPGSYTCLKLN